MQSSTTRILIAGGGIGGLTAALAFSARGFRVSLFEQAEAFAEVGAGIQLSPNCVRVLHHLGLEGPLSAAATRPEAAEFRDFSDGRLIARAPLGEAAMRQFGYPYYHIHRADLLTILLDRAAAYDHLELVTNARASGFDASPSAVILRTSAGDCEGDLLVGADGIHSTLRAQLFGDAAPSFTGNVAWRALVPSDRLPAHFIPPVAAVWWGPGRHLVHYHVRGGDEINCVCVVEKPERELESWSLQGEPDELMQAFAGWHPKVRALMENIDPHRCFKWGLFDRSPMSQWSRGRVTLLGDACHPMLPFMAQGAAMAIEDAAVLCACVEKHPDPGAAFREYERHRRPRTSRVQNASRRNANIFHMRRPLSRFRDIAANRAQRAIMKRLYDYDALSVVR